MNTQNNETISAAQGQLQDVLIVDDSKVMRLALKKILNTDFRVLEASDGEEAWEILSQNHNVKIVFSDLSMPNLDGFGLLDRVRKSSNQSTSNIPFIVITGNEDDDGTREKALSKGATDFITKPFKSAEIKARAKTHVGYQEKIEDITSTFEQKIPLDQVTSLAKHEYFEQRASQLLSYASRHRTDLSLLMIHLEINADTTAPRLESLLQEIAHVVREYTRNEDIASHYGDGDFRILLPGVDLVGAEKLGSRFENFITGFEASNSGNPEIERLILGASAMEGTESRISLEDLVKIAEKNSNVIVLHAQEDTDVVDSINTEFDEVAQQDVPDMVQDTTLSFNVSDDLELDIPVSKENIVSDLEPTQLIDLSTLEAALEQNEQEEEYQDPEITQMIQIDDSYHLPDLNGNTDEIAVDMDLDLDATEFMEIGSRQDHSLHGQELQFESDSLSENVELMQIEDDVQNLFQQEENEEIPEIQYTENMSSDKEDALEYANKLKMHIEERSKNIENEREKIRENSKKRVQEAEERAKKRAEDFARKRSQIEASLNPQEHKADEKETAQIREALKALREKENKDGMEENAGNGFMSLLFGWVKKLFGRK